MNRISQLSNNRLQISLNTVNADPTIPASIKHTLTLVHEYLYEHTLGIQIIQKQMSHKANSTELNFGLSHKLSVLEFLEYFAKIQNIIQIVENNVRNQEDSCSQFIQQISKKFQRIEESMVGVRNQWERKKKIQQLQSQEIRKQLKQMNKKLQKLKISQQDLQISQQKRQIDKQKQNKCINSNNNNGMDINLVKYNGTKSKPNQNITQISGNINIDQLLNEIKQLQECCNQMKFGIQQLAVDFKNIKEKHQQLIQTTRYSLHQPSKNESINREKFVTFNQLREVLGSLQNNLNLSLALYIKQQFSQQKILSQNLAQSNERKKFTNQPQNFINIQTANTFSFSRNTLQPQKLYNQKNKQSSSVLSIANSHYSCQQTSQGYKSGKLFNSNYGTNMGSSEQNMYRKKSSLTPSFNFNKQNNHQSCRGSIYSDNQSDFHALFQRIKNERNQIFKAQWITNYRINDQRQQYKSNVFLAQKISYIQNNTQCFQDYGLKDKNIYQINQRNQILIKRKGFYQIICGLIMKSPVQLKLYANQNIIASHVFSQTPKNHMLCRAIMLYVKVETICEVTITCKRTQNEQDEKKDFAKNRINTRKLSNYEQKNSEIYQQKDEVQGFICLYKLV